MLAALQKFAKSWFAAAVLGLLIICLAFLGLGTDPFKIQTGSWVVKAGAREVQPQEFSLFFDQAKKRLEQQYQQQIPTEAAVQQGFDRQVLDELVLNESLSEMLTRLGLAAPKALIDQELMKIPAFFDQITGRFDEATFNRLLSENKLTPAIFKKSIGDDILRSQFSTALTAGLKTPRIYSALQGAYGLEQRDLAYFIVTPASVGAVSPPTEAEMQAFLKQNAARLMRPEYRTLQLVRFSSDDFRDQVKADEAEVLKRFNFRKDSLSRPETRTIVQITAKNAAAAADAVARLKRGEDPAAVARALGVEPVIYDNKPRSALFDKTLGDAAFALPAGGVSAPLKGELGLAVLKVTQITPGKTASLEDSRAEIEAEVIKDAAANKAYAQSQVYDETHRSGAGLVEAAAKAGVSVVTVGPVTAQGMGRDGKPVAGLSQDVLKAAFALPAGGESDLVEISAGDQYAVRVATIVPAAPPALAEVRSDLSKLMTAQKQAKKVQDRAEALASRIRKGESVASVAASAGFKSVKLDSMTRAGAQTHEALGREVLQTTYEGSKGQVFTAGVPRQGLLVGRIEAIRPGQASQVAQLAESQRQGFTQEVFQDIGNATRTYAKSKVKARSDRERALRALGLDPAAYAESKDSKTGEASTGSKAP
jgi:peptidyl-prolyl cis-trans isomerase D